MSDSETTKKGLRAYDELERIIHQQDMVIEGMCGLDAQVGRLTKALHDAIRRPMGVVPDSAVPFVTDAGLEAAETRRPRQFDSEAE